jgi:hypothetical protein
MSFIMDFMVLKELPPSAAGASGLLVLFYIIFHFLSKPRSKLDDLPALGKPSDPYLHDFLTEGYQKVFDLWSNHNY